MSLVAEDAREWQWYSDVMQSSFSILPMIPKSDPIQAILKACYLTCV